ncbi:MAG: hypothetical protein RIQ60_3439 [Pseudomonadota bacterium]|jgi:hypothetical protein
MSRPTRHALKIAAAALSLGALLAPVAAQAQGWQFLPLLNDPGYKPEPSVALTVDRVDPGQGSSVDAYGLDVNVNCGLIQSPDKRIRTHINLSASDDAGVKTSNFELSPRYTLPLAGMPGLSLGAGPSLGLFKVQASGAASRTLTGVGLAAGINYRSGAFYAGADLRKHSTSAKDGVDLDPLTWGVKVGVNF